MDRPLVFEINTRCWLRELSNNVDRPLTLDTVPDTEFFRWKNCGFTDIWLMGVWTTGPKAREVARTRSDLRALAAEAFGACEDSCLGSSPYAVADYKVSESLGGPDALRKFRERLRHYEMGLILDFVPNHVGPDHPWVASKTDLMVTSTSERPETIPISISGRTVWVAHGRDPYFPAWNDTAQLDYRSPATRAAMIEVLQTVANECDGVRCDMAMLVLNDVFEKTWQSFPAPQTRATGEFWADAIGAVRRVYPNFLFIAEAYWDMEPQLQSLGFDYSYDKVFYDKLTQRDSAGLQAHIQSAKGFQPVRFLENHDEPRIASVLPFAEHQAAALLLLSQPGMRLLHDGQLTGRKRRIPVQFECYWPEPPDPQITDFYRSILQKGKLGV